MKRDELKIKHFSLSVILATFILAMSSFLIINLITKDETYLKSKLIDTEYSIETINPLIIQKAKQEEDKTNINIELKNEIEKIYNIDILYGSGTEAIVKTVDAQTIYNSKNINSLLLEIIDCLEKYPRNIFKEIELKDYTVEICLVDFFNNDNIALATRDSNNNFRIYISNNRNNKKITRAIHHETYHILEYYMKLEYDINELFKDWSKYNPKDFSYQENLELLDTSYVFNLDKQHRTYFVSIYSKVSEKEDRAEVFSDTMIAEEIPTYYMDDTGAIKGKMKLIADVISKCFYTVEYNTNIYWTRYFN